MTAILARGPTTGRHEIRVSRDEASEAVRAAGLSREDQKLLADWCLYGECGETLYFHDNVVTRELFGVL